MVMLAVNVKMPKKRVLLFWIILLAIVLTVVIFRFDIGDAKSADTVSVTDSFSVADYVASFGVETDRDTLVIDEVIIPDEFNDVYESYNQIQKQQGFDLSDYKGCTLSRYTLKVTNYTDKTKEVYAEVMTYKSRVVAADIYCTDADGFILGLK